MGSILVLLLALQHLSLSPQRLIDLLLFLLDQELLHRVVVIVTLDQELQLPLLLEHRPMPPRLLPVHIRVRATSTTGVRILGRSLPTVALLLPFPALYVLPPDLALLEVLVVPRLVPRVVDADEAAPDSGAAEVVNGQVGAALVLIFEPAEAAALARVAVARQLEEGRLAVLREDGDDVALGELEGQPAEEDEGRVAVVDVP